MTAILDGRRLRRINARPAFVLARARGGTVVHIWVSGYPVCNRRGLVQGDGDNVAKGDLMCTTCAARIDTLAPKRRAKTTEEER